jgi:fumarate hydratase class II
MTSPSQHIMSRRGFCLCCIAATTVAASGGWPTTRQAFAKARNIVDLIREELRNEILGGQHHATFPLHLWKTGSGTQVNMNAMR